jgi:hypothetical protein
MAADILAIESGNDYYYNGNYMINYGAKATFESQWDAANSGLYHSITSGLISSISGEYDDDFDDVGYYVTGGA